MFNLHKTGTKVLTRESLREAFLLQYGDSRRNDAMAARERLIKYEHAMKPEESIAEYTQRFYEVIREATDMAERDKISWYKAGLVPAMRDRCAVNEEGKDWESRDKLILYSVGQETRWKAGRTKSVTTADVRALESKLKRSYPFKNPQARDRGVSKKPRREVSTDCRSCGKTKANLERIQGKRMQE